MENFSLSLDMHMHTVLSDGTDTPAEIAVKAKDAGMDLFSVTDHDSVKAAESVLSVPKEERPLFIPGAEFSCKDEHGKYHILGYGFDTENESLAAVVSRGHSLRMKKVLARLDFLKSSFGFEFPEEEIKALLSLDNPGKPHIGNLMVKYGYAETKKQAISDYIDKAYFRSEYIRPEEAISGILAAGGIPVLAHPCYGSGNELILGEEMESRLLRLIDFGLRGMEAFYSGFTGKLRGAMIGLAERYGMLITAGSDYHGMNKLVKLGDTGLREVDEYPKGLFAFLREIAPLQK